MLTGLLTLALALIAADPSEFRVLTGKVIHIADGDTLTLLDSNKEQHKIRLHGIDAPEKKQAFVTHGGSLPRDSGLREGEPAL